MSNVIFIEFYNKKDFPTGKWSSEPDLCHWFHHDLSCLTIRDMSLGIWRGFVGVDSNHPFYDKQVAEILKHNEMEKVFHQIHGGVTGAGRLPSKYKEYDTSLWWFAIETVHSTDLFPLVKIDTNDPALAKIAANRTYKDLSFIRRETNKLAKVLSQIKNKT